MHIHTDERVFVAFDCSSCVEIGRSIIPQNSEVIFGQLLSEQLVKLGELLDVANLQLCLLYLRQRELLLPHRWLHFDSANPQEDQGLDLLINHLVKSRLAAIEMQEASPRGVSTELDEVSARGVEKNHYTYKLKPNWAAIGDYLAQREADLQPEIADWLNMLKG